MPSSLDDLAERRLVLLFLWAAGVAALAALVGHFWIPLDDGTLAQSAARVLRGQLPQRDFGDPYTGLNAILGALALRLFGIRLISLRIPLVAGFALWLPGMWMLCRRFASSSVALAATGLAAVVSVPAYPAAMPTWFGLFLVTWGALALVRFTGRLGDDGATAGGSSAQPGGSRAAARGPGEAQHAGSAGGSRRRWLVLAGVAAGTSILFKVVGLYFVAAALLALARARSGGRTQWWVTLVGVAAFLVVVGRLVLPLGGASGAARFFVPVAVLALAVAAGAWRRRHERERGAWKELGLDAAALCAGLVLPVLLFLVPYALNGGLRAWVVGVFVRPTRRLVAAASAPAPAWTVVPGLAAVGLLWAAGRLRASSRGPAALALAALLTLGLAADGPGGGAFLTILWYAALTWLPALALWAAWLFARSPSEHPEAFAVVATAVLWSLVSFPYASPAYFFYVAPLVVPATLAVVRASGRRPGAVLGVLAVVFLLLGGGYAAGVAASGTTPLPGDRGGIRVSAADARLYGALVDTVRARAAGGGLWATPDAPEVYFLTGLPNPTRTLYEFLDPEPPDSAAVASMLRTHHVRVVVLNTRPLFSPLPGPPVLRLLRERYPRTDTLGPFVVRWRGTP